MDSEEPQSFPHPKIAIDTLTDEEIETALKVFQALEKRPSEIQQEKFKVLRKSAGHVMMSAYDGKYKTKTKEKKEKLSEKKLQQQADKSLLRSRGMMQQKRDAAEKRGLKMLTADGNEESAFGAEVLPYKGNGTVELPPVALPPPIETPTGLAPTTSTFAPIQCYICQAKFNSIHFFYDKLCPACAALNWEKRLQIADLRGQIAICTGSRVKIGHQCCLRLLHCGAFVIATTRFPNDCAARFMADPNFHTFAHRLHIFGLDFRDVSAVQRFCDFVAYSYPRLDIVVNNAAQTVRRPPMFYSHLVEGEEKTWEELPRKVQLMRRWDPRYRKDWAGHAWGMVEEGADTHWKRVKDPLRRTGRQKAREQEVEDELLRKEGRTEELQKGEGMEWRVKTSTGIWIGGDTHVLYSSAVPKQDGENEGADGSEEGDDDEGCVMSEVWPYITPEYQIVGDSLVRYVPSLEAQLEAEQKRAEAEKKEEDGGEERSTPKPSTSLVRTTPSALVLSTPSSLPVPSEPSLLLSSFSQRKRAMFTQSMSTPFGGQMMFEREGDQIVRVKRSRGEEPERVQVWDDPKSLRTEDGAVPMGDEEAKPKKMRRTKKGSLVEDDEEDAEEMEKRREAARKREEERRTEAQPVPLTLPIPQPIRDTPNVIRLSEAATLWAEDTTIEENPKVERTTQHPPSNVSITETTDPISNSTPHSIQEPADDTATPADSFSSHTSTASAPSIDIVGLLTSSNPTHSAPTSLQSHLDSALLSQVPLLESDETDTADFPVGVVDLDNQQIDLRGHNTWISKLDEVSTVELIEVHYVNTFSPFILSSRLAKKMSEDQTKDAWIVNVSAMEGKFNRKHKDGNHPHTNMAKASLNMLTRTSAADLATKRIFMNSVDTGWITDEKPLEKAVESARGGFSTPIDEVDAMARILDPIFVGINTGVLHFGKFWKDYMPSEW